MGIFYRRRTPARCGLSFTGLILLLALVYLLTAGCGKKETIDPRIGIIGKNSRAQRLDEALSRMGQPFEVIETVDPAVLGKYDMVILSRGAYADKDTGLADNYSVILDYVHNGGSLLVLGLEEKSFRNEFLPFEIRFATEDPSGWGNVDFSEEIAAPDHPIFNFPHRLSYLAGLEESSRIVYTAPEWRILLAKDPRHPVFDYKLDKSDNSVGSIFEVDYGSGHILVCQPLIDLYHAGKASIVPHPLEQGVLLFENVVEYMKSRAIGKSLPFVIAQASPKRGPPGQPVQFRSRVDGISKGPFSYSWDFGDGAQSNEPAPEHKYEREGIYWATVTVTVANGAVDRAVCRVQIDPAKPMRWADYLVEMQMHRYYPEPGNVGMNYRTALLLSGMLDVYERTRDPEILNYIISFFDKRLISRWDSRPFKGEMQPSANFVDIYSLMASAYRLYKITGKEVYLDMCREVWDQSLKVDSAHPTGSLWCPWPWHGRKAIVDFTYFKAHMRALIWEETGNTALLDEAAGQMILFAGTFMDPADSLFFMAIDLDRKEFFTSPSRPSGLNDSKWGRANGWMSLAFTELIARLPENHPKRKKLVKIIRTFFTGLVHAQDTDTGLWALITDKLDYPGMWLETTSTSMFVYSLCRLVELGVLPPEPFTSAARRGYNGLQQRIKLGAFNYPYLSDCCQGTMVRINLARWLQAHRRDNDYHALGPFLMAEEALWRLAPPDVAVIGTLRPGESTLGMTLNRAGFFFHQIPNLYTAVDLGSFSRIFVDKGAFDRNDADVRAYARVLLDFAQAGGTVVYFSQQEVESLLEGLPSGIDFKRKAYGKPVVEHDATWETVPLDENSDLHFLRKRHGLGNVLFCDSDLTEAMLEAFK